MYRKRFRCFYIKVKLTLMHKLFVYMYSLEKKLRLHNTVSYFSMREIGHCFEMRVKHFGEVSSAKTDEQVPSLWCL